MLFGGHLSTAHFSSHWIVRTTDYLFCITVSPWALRRSADGHYVLKWSFADISRENILLKASLSYTLGDPMTRGKQPKTKLILKSCSTGYVLVFS